MNKTNKQALHLIAIYLIVFALGGVLLPATGLQMFTHATPKTVASLTILLIVLFIVTVMSMGRAEKG
jgi:hypothetical protein